MVDWQHNVLIVCHTINEVDAKCQCGWSKIKCNSAVQAKSEWLKHVKKRKGKPGKITIRGL